MTASTGVISGRIIAFGDTGRRIGEGHQNSKLSDADVDLVFELREAGLNLREIGEKFGVQKAAIWKILHGHTRGEAPSEWRPATARRTSPPRGRPAKTLPAPAEDGPGALLQRHLNQAWR